MKNSLKTLQRIQKFNIDEQRKILVDLQTKQDQLKVEFARLNQNYEAEKAYAVQHPGLGNFGAFVKHYLEKKEALESAIDKMQQAIEEVRDRIADMFKEQKTYEIVDDNRRKREIKEENDKEQKMLDEVGTNTYIKKHEAGAEN
ncbi:MAG: flagellar export protein FliJ [Alphaproteobacteria bacterium]|nr:flagellar export protein FliJ [Alphaproteobacteria bacterium]